MEQNASKIDKMNASAKSTNEQQNGLLVKFHGQLDRNTSLLSECKTILERITIGFN